MNRSEQEPRMPVNGRDFCTTHWSTVLRAGDAQSLQSLGALEKLCGAYWYPLYAYVRRQGRTPHDAQDLTQEFLSRLLEKNVLSAVHPDKGRFRSFLIASLNHFLANDWKHSQRQKRGGSHTHFSLDEETAEGRYRHEPADQSTPEKVFGIVQGPLPRRLRETIYARQRLSEMSAVRGAQCSSRAVPGLSVGRHVARGRGGGFARPTACYEAGNVCRLRIA